MKKMTKRIPSQGVALITVMLVVALAAILVTQMTARLQLQMQRTTNIAFNQQAYWYAMGAEAFAKRVLIASFADDDNTTHLQQLWAQGETSYPVDFGQISGEIRDLHACLNLNALRADSTPQDNSNAQGDSETKGNVSGQGKATNKLPARVAFIELLLQLNIDGVSQFEAEYMADALSDWLDEDSAIVSAGGAEDNDYSAREFPYLPANNYLASVNELRVIEHFSAPTIQALKDYVCILPNSNLHQINLNTLTLEKIALLQALLEIPQDVAEQALAARPEDGFKQVDDFFNLAELSKEKIDPSKKQQFVVDSEYFTLKTTASFNNSYFTLTSVMRVATNNQINVISRTIGRD